MGTTSLRLRCPDCGRVSVSAATTILHQHRDGFRLVQGACPHCGEVLATADAGVVEHAIAAGVRTQELLTPLPPLSPTDLDDLLDALAGDDWAVDLLPDQAPDPDNASP